MKKRTKLEDYESICHLCNKIYDRREDSKEMKKSGEYICLQCWDKKE